MKNMYYFINYLYALEIKSCDSDHNIRITKISREDAALHIKNSRASRSGHWYECTSLSKAELYNHWIRV